MAYHELIELTLPEHWPESLAKWSLPRRLIRLSTDDLKAMASVYPDLRRLMGINTVHDFSERLLTEIDTSCSVHRGTGVFVKTSYGMLKENPLAYAPVFSRTDFEANVRFPDKRIGGYLHNRLALGSAAFLQVTPWQYIPPWSEYRLFINGSRLCGASQYHYTKAYPEIVSDHARIHSTLESFAAELVGVLHVDPVIVDVKLTRSPANDYVAQLVELNPFMPSSDPCLYSWKQGGDFDDSFRWLHE